MNWFIPFSQNMGKNSGIQRIDFFDRSSAGFFARFFDIRLNLLRKNLVQEDFMKMKKVSDESEEIIQKTSPEF